MVNVNKLKGKIIERGMNVGTLAKDLKIDKSTLYRKLNDKGETFTIKEANEILEVLELTIEEANAIFFNSKVADERLSRGEINE